MQKEKVTRLRVRFLHWAPLFILFFLSVPATADVASWYGPGFHGRTTANGEKFNKYAMTAAHKTLPFNTIVKVCKKKRCVTVRINDRGPFIKGRTIDLSEAAAKKIRCSGVCNVTVTIVRSRRNK